MKRKEFHPNKPGFWGGLPKFLIEKVTSAAPAEGLRRSQGNVVTFTSTLKALTHGKPGMRDESV